MNHATDNLILPECYIETNLIEALVPPQHGYNHQKGCPAVAKKMKEKFADSFALGIMDKDKRRVSYLQEFSLIASDQDLEIYKHKERPHYILLISPAVEGFILKAASTLKLDLRTYEIPVSLEGMKKETKQIDAQSSRKYRKLFRALSPAPEFQKLAKIISYLKDKRYEAQEGVIREMIE